MRVIGILADYLTPLHKEKLSAAAERNGFAVRYFTSPKEAEGHLADCEILYGYIPASYLKAASSLKWLHTASAGVDSYLKDEIYPHPDVILTNSNGSYGITIAEHIVMTVLMMMRRMPQYEKLMASRGWKNLGTIRSIYGSSFVIVGTGSIGTSLAQRLKGMGAGKITGVRRDLSKPSDPAFDAVTTLEHLAEVVKDVDVIALCVPATNETKGLLSKEILDSLSPKTLIVNVGRGSAIDQDALIQALNEERIAGAALDVMIPEPLPADSPLYDAKNVILTPHVSGNMTLSFTCDINVDIFLRNLERYAHGEPLHHLVDRIKGY